MTPKEILLKAADGVEQRNISPYCCIALKAVAGFYYDNEEEYAEWQKNSESYYYAFDKFKSLYKPVGVAEDESWFYEADYEVRRQARVDALRATAATFD